jgi:hypothetical protein
MWVKTRVGNLRYKALLPRRQLMVSFHDSSIAHWSHEPGALPKEARNGERKKPLFLLSFSSPIPGSWVASTVPKSRIATLNR